ncbi:hypothetical protein FRAHR75_110013 [Frankia sp. Hr75.2]|nr:hypothetical protein FRAHR75_110013 [Frankia sp. Hr75.2]SQD98311.1 hypothetical protein FMEAI12_4600024 [Parafrankia sp. Ea1.12]
MTDRRRVDASSAALTLSISRKYSLASLNFKSD